MITSAWSMVTPCKVVCMWNPSYSLLMSFNKYIADWMPNSACDLRAWLHKDLLDFTAQLLKVLCMHIAKYK